MRAFEFAARSFFDAGIIHRGWNPLGRARWTLHNVTWGSAHPVTWDYDPTADARWLPELLCRGLPSKFDKYLRDFLGALHTVRRMLRVAVHRTRPDALMDSCRPL